MRTLKVAHKTFPPPPSRSAFRTKEWKVIQKLRTPKQVQDFLYSLPYNREKKGETLRSFRGVIRHGEAHCLEAALTAATILEQHGYPPLFLDIESQDNLDHVLFIFFRRGRWGAVARSRDAGLQGRKPVFRNLLQLVRSFVDPFVDASGRMTGYAVFDLRTMGDYDWRLSGKNVWAVERALIRLPHKKIKTSDRRYRKLLARYLAFRRKYPHRPVVYYSNRHRWM
jgi:hypothetical protein